MVVLSFKTASLVYFITQYTILSPVFAGVTGGLEESASPPSPPCCKVYNPPPHYRKTPRPNKVRVGKCKDGNVTYQIGDRWNYDPECVERECKEDGTIAINSCPSVPENLPLGWELKADSEHPISNFYPFCCKRPVPTGKSGTEPGCYTENRTVEKWVQVDIPGRCYEHVCTGDNEWHIAECSNLRLWHAWEVLPEDPTKSFPECCGKTVPILDIVPDVLDDIPSGSYLGIHYRTASPDYGNVLTPSQVQEPPTLNNPPLPPGQSPDDRWNLLIMTDPDVSPSNRTEFLHWMVGNFHGDDVLNGDTLAEYIGVTPPKSSETHRYIFLFFEQPGRLEFEETHLNQTTIGWRENFSTQKFIEKYKLGETKGFNVFRVQWDQSDS